MAQYPKIESTGSIGSIILGLLEVQVDGKAVVGSGSTLHWAQRASSNMGGGRRSSKKSPTHILRVSSLSVWARLLMPC